jgi:hypothetical protein
VHVAQVDDVRVVERGQHADLVVHLVDLADAPEVPRVHLFDGHDVACACRKWNLRCIAA